MNPKENALEILKFGNPEYIQKELPSITLAYTGVNHEGYTGGGHSCPVGSVWTDIWGTEWHKEHPDVMGFPKGNPLAEMEAFDSFVWPDPNDERICGKIYEIAERITDEDRRNRFVAGSHRDTLWEKSYMLVGMENMMIYMFTEPEYAKKIFHKIMDFQLGIAEHYIKCGVEVITMSDDLGTQRALLMSKELIEEFLIPEYRRLFDFYKKRGVKVHFHSCGHIEPILETFIELGVDILNPVQATANDLSKVIEVTNKRMCIHGAISTALLESGPTQAIDAEVKRVISLLGANGGYFCAPDQAMPIPKEHMEAFYTALEKYGKYPLEK